MKNKILTKINNFILCDDKKMLLKGKFCVLFSYLKYKHRFGKFSMGCTVQKPMKLIGEKYIFFPWGGKYYAQCPNRSYHKL